MSRNKPVDLLVCYDIREERRLRRVHRCMCRWGMPLQYSVFYCNLNLRARRRLEKDLRDLIDERVDDVRVYGLKSYATIEFMGKKPFDDAILVLSNSVLGDISVH